VETAATVEIEKDAFGDFFLMIPTPAWKAQNAFHSYHSVGDGHLHLYIEHEETQHFFYSPTFGGCGQKPWS